MSPRPILKRDPPSIIPTNPLPFAACPTLISPRVHFPPTPVMVASTHPAHSRFVYDRAPIVVSPNVCIMPNRGDREYHTNDDAGHSQSVDQPRGRSRTKKTVCVKDSYFHPRAYEACEREPSAGHTYDEESDCEIEYNVESISPIVQAACPPPLIHDLSSSESDESDVTTPPDSSLSTLSSSTSQQPNSLNRKPPLHPLPSFTTMSDTNTALSFLPHPPSPPRDKEKEEKRKRSTTPAARPCKPCIKRTSAFAEPELEGCLGGF